MKSIVLTPSTWGPPVPRPRLRLVLLLAAAATLAGCASFSPDGGFSTVEQAARERLGKEVRWARTPGDQDGIDQRVAELLAKPLSADDAVQIALLNNRGLQASFQELGITEAEVVQSGRVPNPGFSFSRLRRGDEINRSRRGTGAPWNAERFFLRLSRRGWPAAASSRRCCGPATRWG